MVAGRPGRVRSGSSRVGDAIAAATEILTAAGVTSPRHDAEALAAHLLGVGRGDLVRHETLDPAHRQRIWEILQTMLNDNRQAWDMSSDGAYTQRKPADAEAERGTHQALMSLARQRTPAGLNHTPGTSVATHPLHAQKSPQSGSTPGPQQGAPDASTHRSAEPRDTGEDGEP